MRTVVCTLFEGHYHFGVGALANSLFVSGYRGILWAGYRGDLPPWGNPAAAPKSGIHHVEIADGFSIAFVPLKTGVHFTYFKPYFLDQVLDELDLECDAAIYIDPDIVVKGPWHLLNRWPRDGVALVHDVHSLMPERHPMRLAWRDFLTARKISADFPRDRYYSGGFVGISRSQRNFLGVWREIVEIVQSEIGVDAIKHGDAGELFHSADQDALNIALMACDTPVNAAHSESMDFATGGYLLSHAIGTPKPWQGGFIRRALKGVPPGLAIKAFMRHTESPIDLLDSATRRKLRCSVTIASAIGRFYGRA
ncbi:MAG TPA: hypothetical protein VIM61_08205 [Chthoniobacterales bacterium]|jgi:hypothetical protein